MVFNDYAWQLEEIYKVKPKVILFGKHIVLVLYVNVKCILNHRMSQLLTVVLVLVVEIVTFFLVYFGPFFWSFLVSVNSAIIKVTGYDVHAKI